MNELTQDLLKELFDYRDGNLYWAVSKGQHVKIGDLAGSVGKEGYRMIGINGKVYRAHRLIFLYHHGYLPGEIDHIDGNKLNNNINNLRESTHQQNHMNRKKTKSINGKPTSSDFKGVYLNKRDKKWAAYIYIDGKKKHLGYHTSEIEAALAYDQAAIERDGEFAKTNKSLGLL